MMYIKASIISSFLKLNNSINNKNKTTKAPKQYH